MKRETARERRDRKRQEAEQRNSTANARLRNCGHVHGDAQVARCEQPVTPEERLLQDIFGGAR